MSLFDHNLVSVFDIEAWARGCDLATLKIEPLFTIRFFTFHSLDARRRGEGAEGEVGGIVVVRIAGVFQVFACADVFQGESLAVDIVDVPHGAVFHVLAIAFCESEDETAPACLYGLRIQVAGLAPDVVGLSVGRDESQQVAARHRALLQTEEIA